ncbi:hypothetical protein T440DRAFT_55160 [Plenodomus tracheiphilus IPT5]|uniref:Uncharacterized protein n=1 Tax=Plenodomus tracheiphilus IPT5 TaxID=1408161 RepID=A0A6A7B8S9_9PLEO|nr:hypothetical protein T440DRAFT_55160 [Plenodomus tracheiphilus IPT5]
MGVGVSMALAFFLFPSLCPLRGVWTVSLIYSHGFLPHLFVFALYCHRHCYYYCHCLLLDRYRHRHPFALKNAIPQTSVFALLWVCFVCMVLGRKSVVTYLCNRFFLFLVSKADIQTRG